jgi:hypothetical protein
MESRLQVFATHVPILILMIHDYPDAVSGAAYTRQNKVPSRARSARLAFVASTHLRKKKQMLLRTTKKNFEKKNLIHAFAGRRPQIFFYVAHGVGASRHPK